MNKIYKSCSPKYTDDDVKRLSGVGSTASYATLMNKSIKEAIHLTENEKIVGMVMDFDGIHFWIETNK